MISIQENIKSVKVIDTSMDAVLKRIKDGKSKNKIDLLRQTKDEVEKREIKQTLPVVRFAGVWNSGAVPEDKSIKSYSGFMICDIDHVDAVAVKETLRYDPYVYAIWISPSGDGVKFLMKISDPKKYKQHYFAAMVRYPELDKNNSNISRACFESYDPDLVLNKDSIVFDKTIEKDQIGDSMDMNKLSKWIEKRDSFIQGSRNQFIFKLAAAANRFGIPKDICQTFCGNEYRCDSDFTKNEMASAINSAYKNTADFGSAGKDLEKIGSDFMRYEPIDVFYIKDVEDDLNSIYANGLQYGESTGYPTLDSIYKMEKGELTIVTGWANDGKSEFMNNLTCARAFTNNDKWAFFSPETFPPSLFYKKFIEIYAGCSMANTYMNTDKFEKAKAFVSRHFFFIYPDETPNVEYLLNRFMEQVVTNNITGIVIDPFNEISNNFSLRDDQFLQTNLSLIKRFIRENDLFGYVVMHPHQVKRNQDGSLPRATKYDLAGGAMTANKADNILVYSRPNLKEFPDSTNASIFTEKIKKQPQNGALYKEVECMFDWRSRRFTFNGTNPFIDALNTPETPMHNGNKIIFT